MSSPAAPKKGVAMCCVTVGYRAYLMPVNKGMELVKLMTSAFETEPRYVVGKGEFYEVGEQPEATFCLVKPSQIKPKPDGAQLLIGMD